MTTNERLTLAISTVALIVSGLSLWDSHDSSNVHRAEAAPHLAILSAHFTRLSPSDARSLGVLLQVINSGELGVKVAKAEIHPQLSALPGQEALQPCFDDLDKQTFKNPRSERLNEKLGPKGKIGIVSMLVELPSSCSDGGWTFVGTVDFEGQDDAGHKYDSGESTDVPVFKAVIPNK